MLRAIISASATDCELCHHDVWTMQSGRSKWHAASVMAELYAANKPHQKYHNQYEPDGPACAWSDVAIIPLVATPTAEQKDHQDYDENCAHDHLPTGC